MQPTYRSFYDHHATENPLTVGKPVYTGYPIAQSRRLISKFKYNIKEQSPHRMPMRNLHGLY